MRANPIAIMSLALGMATMSAAMTARLHAQDNPRPAVVIGGMPGLGVLLPMGQRWALRPDLSLSGLLQYAGGASQVPPRSTARVGVGLSVLRLGKSNEDSLSTYLVARVGYQAIHSGSPAGEAEPEAFEAQAQVGAGLHLQPHDRFGFFTELVAEYALQRTSLESPLPRTSTFTRWQLRPTMGVSLRRRSNVRR